MHIVGCGLGALIISIIDHNRGNSVTTRVAISIFTRIGTTSTIAARVVVTTRVDVRPYHD